MDAQWHRPGSTLLTGVVPGVLVLALGMATLTAPLEAATFNAVDQTDQGVASGMNNATGQLAGLLAIAILPAVAGLSCVPLSDPAFAAGHTAAMRIAAASRRVGQRRSL